MPQAITSLQTGLSRYLSLEQQKLLGSTVVGIAGAGGLGSNVAVNLVRSGVKHLVIADFDHIDASNLNRQFYFQDQIGMAKVSALSDNLNGISSDVSVVCHETELTADNITDVFSECAIIVEAFDGAPAKKMIVEKFLHSGRVLIAASGIGGFGEPDTIRTRQVKPTFYIVGDESTPSDNRVPPMSPRVNIAAAMQADLVLRHIIGTHTGAC